MSVACKSESVGAGVGFDPGVSGLNAGGAMSARPGYRLLLLAFGLWVGLLLPDWGVASPANEAEQRRADLEAVKARLRELQKEIAATEASHDSAVGALAAAEREVSRLERRLRQLAAERQEAEQALTRLAREQVEVQSRIDARQAELGDWLRRHYMFGAAGGIAPLLSARDPNQLARDAHYLEHLGRARLALIETLRGDLKQKADLAAAEAARRDRLAALEAEQTARRAELQTMHATRQRAVAELAERLKGQRQEASSLRQDEQRLSKLIDALVRAARAQQRAREQAAASASRQRSGTVRSPAQPAEPVVATVREAAGPMAGGVDFDKLRGRLRFPVRGELVGRFGAPRAEGGTSWRGVFIRAAGGADVRAVAAGEVVYSDWLRGFGNLIILDHGKGYLTVYGNNDALLREVGDRVAGGDTIASVGSSGAGEESGLYFEIRHEGRPVDPMQWVRLD